MILKKKIVGLFVFMMTSVFAENVETLYVSLGSNCQAAVSIQENKLRKEAYPFDWLLTFNEERLIALLEDDFSFFLDERYLFRDPNLLSAVENSYYEMEFRYDFSIESDVEFKESLKEVQAKYDRRIQRFRALNDHSGKVFFIRVAYDLSNGGPCYWWQEKYASISKENAEILKETLGRFFPSLDFTLVIVNYTEENVPKIEGIEGIIEFKIRKSHRVIDYMKMLRSLRKKAPVILRQES